MLLLLQSLDKNNKKPSAINQLHISRWSSFHLICVYSVSAAVVAVAVVAAAVAVRAVAPVAAAAAVQDRNQQQLKQHSVLHCR